LLLPVLLLGGRWVHLQIAYAQVEALTQRHGEEFTPDLITYIDEVYNSKDKRFHTQLEYLKVFEYTESKAKVFAAVRTIGVSDFPMNCPEGDFFYFNKANSIWLADRSRLPDMIWSCGSADEETWPPY